MCERVDLVYVLSDVEKGMCEEERRGINRWDDRERHKLKVT